MASKSDIQLAEVKMQNESDREIARNNFELRLILEENNNSQRTQELNIAQNKQDNEFLTNVIKNKLEVYKVKKFYDTIVMVSLFTSITLTIVLW